ncbi:MAG: conjugal transfer protein TraX [Oscillospiraceae bacterium]|nr:conjugal transfer protein TraX [Oscillospiraceae bacterium]
MPKLNAFQLKWIAIIGMILNHMVLAWWDIIPTWLAVPMYAAGGLTFPIMAYFVVEGYRHTSNLGKYIGRLALFGLIALPFHALTFGAVMLNILFTIVISLFCLWLYDKMAKVRPLFWIAFVIICFLTVWPVMFDWLIIGPIVVMMTHVIKHEKRRRTLPAILAGIFFFVTTALGTLGAWMLNNMPEDADAVMLVDIPAIDTSDIVLMAVSCTFVIGCIAAALLLRNFNGDRGKRMKWAFYIVYPVHLAVIGLVAWLAIGSTSPAIVWENTLALRALLGLG